MQCRATQALHLLGLEPISEMVSNPNAYGFRPKRSAADAIRRCFIALGKKGSAQYVLEADIKSCFDKISHQWVLENVPMDKDILRSWLKAGYIYEGKAFPTNEGTPQGGVNFAVYFKYCIKRT
jgi:RNA-directed DNA polymerase